MAQLDALSEQGLLRLFYGDESHVCSEGYVPYGWQFPDEEVFMSAQKGFRANCWGLISRDNDCHWATTCGFINAAFVAEKPDALSFTILVPAVVVLDNAKVHTARSIQQSRASWAQRGLSLFFLPPYSPHLNIAGTLWRHLKGGWLVPEDYRQDDDLAYALNRCLSNVGKSLKIQFSQFNAN